MIVVNDAWRLAPWADALYAADEKWWDFHKGVPDFAGEKWTHDPGCAARWRLQRIAGRQAPGFSFTPGLLHFGGNGGFQAINLALQFGARRIVLLGLDMKPAPNGVRHWFGEHPGIIRKPSGYADWLVTFAEAAPALELAGVRVVNCTPGSALGCFPLADLQETLARW